MLKQKLALPESIEHDPVFRFFAEAYIGYVYICVCASVCVCVWVCVRACECACLWLLKYAHLLSADSVQSCVQDFSPRHTLGRMRVCVFVCLSSMYMYFSSAHVWLVFLCVFGVCMCAVVCVKSISFLCTYIFVAYDADTMTIQSQLS